MLFPCVPGRNEADFHFALPSTVIVACSGWFSPVQAAVSSHKSPSPCIPFLLLNSGLSVLSATSHISTTTMSDKLTRIAIVSNDKCKPKVSPGTSQQEEFPTNSARNVDRNAKSPVPLCVRANCASKSLQSPRSHTSLKPYALGAVSVQRNVPSAPSTLSTCPQTSNLR